ncbi:MAG: hypothetical protein FJ087_21185, partial [Deltaproteobacteria bacterium]|nr:hypothetical protein [Deltaproteobacteria bacterium]
MDATELLTALESNAADTAGLEQALQQALAEGVSDLDSFLAQVVPLLGKSEAAESVLKVLDAVFRRNRETDVGRVVGRHAGVLCWRALGDLVRAEFYMRALGDGGDHAAEWQDFYCRFYASRGNWLRLEQFMTETAQRTGMAAVEMKRALACTAHDVGNSAKEMSYWQAVAQAAPSDAEANRELERLYSQLERWSSLADLLKE